MQPFIYKYRSIFNRYSPVSLLIAFLILSVSLSSCSDDKGCTDPSALNFNPDADESCDECCEFADEATVKFNVEHNVDDQPLEFDKLKFINPFGREFKVTKLRYYLSDFKFHHKDGSVHEVDMFQLINAKESSTLTFSVPNVPSGEYKKVSFFFGLDEEKNQDQALPSQETVMPWPDFFSDGYHFMQQEGFYLDSTNSEVAFNTHFGAKSKNKDGNRLANNHVTIELDGSDISIDHHEWTLNIAMDLNEWYKNPKDYDFPKFGQGIMGNPNAQQLLHDNAADIFTLTSKVEEDDE